MDERQKDNVIGLGFVDTPSGKLPLVTGKNLPPGVVLRMDNRRGQRLDLMVDGTIVESRYRRTSRRRERAD